MIKLTRRMLLGVLGAVTSAPKPHPTKPGKPTPTPSPTPTQSYASYGELSYGEGLYGG
jgi:hypothetical protein